MDSNIFDKRTVRRVIEKGTISQQDYLDYIAGLEDMADACEPVEEQLYPKDEPEEEGEEESEQVEPSEMM